MYRSRFPHFPGLAKRGGIRSGVLTVIFLSFFILNVWAEEEVTKPQQLVDKALVTFERFDQAEDIPWFHKNIKNAKAVFIVPTLVKAGLLIGGSGGTGVVLARDEKTGEWSYPAFYKMGSVSVGLQAGAAADEVVGLVMTEKGMEQVLYSAFKLGTEVSVVAGPTGAGASAALADVVAYSKSKGAFVGVSIDGAVVTSRDEWNMEYYGEPVTPTDILVRRTASKPQADALRSSVIKAAQSE